MRQSVVKIDPEITSGAPCFAGTRVPIQNLIDYLEGGDSIDDFLDGFPTVSREQVIAFLEEAKESGAFPCGALAKAAPIALRRPRNRLLFDA